MEIKLPNGFSVDFFKEEDGVYIALVNPNNYVVSDRKLTETEINKLTKIMNDFQADRWLKEECK